ncbi:MAG: hypothetical protein YYHSYBAR_002274 [Candidatus Fervidibacter sacchari]
MKSEQRYIYITLLYVVIAIFISQMTIYNVTLTNPVITSYSVVWLSVLLYNIITLLIITKTMSNVVIDNYVAIVRYITFPPLVSFLLITLKDVTITKELNVLAYIKFLLTLLIISLFASLTYFLQVSFQKYRVLWIIGFLGTIILSPLLVESRIFVRDLRFKSLLDFWNWIVPYQSIEQLRQFVFLEGWQGWETALISTIHLLIYWFVIASICLYIRQFQSSWRST